MFPNIINMIKEGEDNKSIKKYIINKMKPIDPHFWHHERLKKIKNSRSELFKI